MEHIAFGISVGLNILAVVVFVKAEYDLRKGDRQLEKVKAIFNTDPDRMFTVAELADAARISELEARFAVRILMEQKLIDVQRLRPGERKYYASSYIPSRASY